MMNQKKEGEHKKGGGREAVKGKAGKHGGLKRLLKRGDLLVAMGDRLKRALRIEPVQKKG